MVAPAGATYAKFDAAFENYWHAHKEPIYLGPYIGVDAKPVILHWGPDKLVERIEAKLGEPLPDVDALNNATDPKTWRDNPFGEGKIAPYALSWEVYLVNPNDASRVVCSNNTAGQHSA
jgi:hypothetical protein